MASLVVQRSNTDGERVQDPSSNRVRDYMYVKTCYKALTPFFMSTKG